jgi:hypothetical protein
MIAEKCRDNRDNDEYRDSKPEDEFSYVFQSSRVAPVDIGISPETNEIFVTDSTYSVNEIDGSPVK